MVLHLGTLDSDPRSCFLKQQSLPKSRNGAEWEVSKLGRSYFLESDDSPKRKDEQQLGWQCLRQRCMRSSVMTWFRKKEDQ